MRTRAILLVVILGSTAGAGAGVGLHYALPESPVVRGLFIGERPAPRGPAVFSWLSAWQDEAGARRVRLRVNDHEIVVTQAEIGIEIDVAATLERAAKIGHEGPLLRRLRETARARRGEIDVPLLYRVDEDKARERLDKIAPEVWCAPVDARLDMKHRLKIPDTPGLALDVEGAIEALRAGTHAEEETIELPMRHVSADVTLHDLTRVDIGKVVSSFETSFVTYGSGRGRAVNIARAASKIDGIVLAQGETFSFNDRVGPRTEETGFTMAPEIQGDETVTGWGGGTCQVSSTLHAAALFGALDVLDRQSHSRPSAYTRMGLDATVSYPRVDLKVRNALPFPIMIHAYLPKPTAIRVEILGGDPVAEVDYTYGIGNTEDFTRRIYVKSYFSSGRMVRRQKGSRGFDVISVATLRYKDGRVEERRYFSGYRPAPEVYWIASDVDAAMLPDLPEHAKGVETGGDEDSFTM